MEDDVTVTPRGTDSNTENSATSSTEQKGRTHWREHCGAVGNATANDTQVLSLPLSAEESQRLARIKKDRANRFMVSVTDVDFLLGDFGEVEPMRVYVASSWRNEFQPGVVAAIRAAGHEVYDFRNPPHGRGGFGWSSIGKNWQEWSPAEYLKALVNPLAEDGFKSDMDALR